MLTDLATRCLDYVLFNLFNCVEKAHAIIFEPLELARGMGRVTAGADSRDWLGARLAEVARDWWGEARDWRGTCLAGRGARLAG